MSKQQQALAKQEKAYRTAEGIREERSAAQRSALAKAKREREAAAKADKELKELTQALEKLRADIEELQ